MLSAELYELSHPKRTTRTIDQPHSKQGLIPLIECRDVNGLHRLCRCNVYARCGCGLDSWKCVSGVEWVSGCDEVCCTYHIREDTQDE